MGFLRLRKRKKFVERKQLHQAIQDELSGYLKKEEIQEYLDKINRDERRKRVWDSMSRRKKLRLLRYVMDKKETSHGKK